MSEVKVRNEEGSIQEKIRKMGLENMHDDTIPLILTYPLSFIQNPSYTLTFDLR
jgi:hypothetical protein